MNTGTSRVAWVDYAKGFCIIMVVMMHSTLGVEAAVGEEGWMHYVVAFAKPFRMPDFFLIAGLFLARVIDRDWRDYLDRKLVHFAYFYILWLTIQFAFKAPAMAAEGGIAAVGEAYLLALVEPFGTMWFIYLLPICFVVTKALRSVPWVLIWIVAAILETLPISTGWIVIDEFAARFVYFYSGYVLAPYIFKLAEMALTKGWIAALYLVAWALTNGLAVFSGIADLPVASLVFGFAGAIAVVAFSALLSKSNLMAPVRYCGVHSLVIYLAFFLPMAISRTALLMLGIIPDVGMMSLIVTACGVVGPLVLYWIVNGRFGDFLFNRPQWARLAASRTRLVPAE
jgi:uncharacterized membrane protein YcfT